MAAAIVSILAPEVAQLVSQLITYEQARKANAALPTSAQVVSVVQVLATIEATDVKIETVATS